MAKKVAPVPKGYRTVTPTMVVRGADAAIAWYQDVFGAELQSHVYADDGVTVLQAEIKIGNALVRLSDEMPAFGVLSPLAFGGASAGLHVYHADADAIWQRALDHGAGVVMPFAATYWGEEIGRLIDPFGHVWSVARRVEALKPEEIAARAAAQAISVVEPQTDEVHETAEVVEAA